MTALAWDRPTPLVPRILAVVCAVVVAAGAATAYHVSTATTPVTVSQALRRFRAETGAPSVAGQQVAAPALPAAAAAPGAAAAPVAAPSASPPSAANRPTAPGGPTAAGQPAPGAPRSGGTAAVAPTTHGVQATPDVTPSAAPGVYTYATSGGESVTVAGGSNHAYPSQTTMTVTATPCGVDVRWDPLKQRSDKWQLCAAGHGIALRSLTTYHEFFNQVDQRQYVCTADTRFRPDSSAPGTTFGGTCTASGAAAALSGSVVGVEQVRVGSSTVAAVHVHLDEQLTGATKGTRTGESWYAVADNLLLRRTSATEADTQTSFGYTHYHEKVELDLTDLHPAT